MASVTANPSHGPRRNPARGERVEGTPSQGRVVADELAPILATPRRRRDNGSWHIAAKAFVAICGGVRLADLNIGHVRSVQESYSHLAQTTRRATDYSVRRVLAAFVEAGAPDLRGAVSIARTAQARQTQPTQSELAALVTTPDLALSWVILCAAEAALRMGTAVTVKPSDVQTGHIVTRTKNGAVTRTPMSDNLATIFAVLPPPEDDRLTVVDLLAGHVYAEPDREFHKRWANWKRKCGVRPSLRLHDLRRGLARRLYAETGDLRIVQSLLTHTNLTSTLHYLDASDRAVLPSMLAAAIKRKDSL